MQTISLTRGIPADESYPLKRVSECMNAVLHGEHAVETMRYGTGHGFTPLRQILAEKNGVKLENVMTGNGSLGFIDLMGLAWLKTGDAVLVESPTYDRTLTLLRRHGLRPVGVKLEPDGVNLDDFERAIRQHQPKLVYIIADFQNPSGSVMSLEKRRRVLGLAEQHGFFVLEDAPYRPLRYTGKNLPSLFELNPERVLQMSSYTKQISPGVRVGTLIGDAHVLHRLAKAANDTYISAAFLGQAMVFEFLRHGLLEPQLAALRALYAPRLKAMIHALEAHMPGANFTRPEGGFFLSLELPEGVSVATLLEHAPQAGLALTDGRGFFPDPNDGERFMRLPFCALTPDEIEEGMKRLTHLIAHAARVGT
jgi:2-aminoadipate transaminase